MYGARLCFLQAKSNTNFSQPMVSAKLADAAFYYSMHYHPAPTYLVLPTGRGSTSHRQLVKAPDLMRYSYISHLLLYSHGSPVTSLVLPLVLFSLFVRFCPMSLFNRATLAKKMAFSKVVACLAAFFLSLSHSQYVQDYERTVFVLPSPPAGSTSNVQTRYW